jgi:hypothetical protein
MHFEIQLLDSQEKAWFSDSRELAGEYLLKLAAERKPMLMEKGMEFAQGAITVFGGELVKAVKGGNSDAIDKAVIEFALAVVTVESCWGIEDHALLNRHFGLTVYENGTVRSDRLEAQGV